MDRKTNDDPTIKDSKARREGCRTMPITRALTAGRPDDGGCVAPGARHGALPNETGISFRFRANWREGSRSVKDSGLWTGSGGSGWPSRVQRPRPKFLKTQERQKVILAHEAPIVPWPPWPDSLSLGAGTFSQLRSLLRSPGPLLPRMGRSRFQMAHFSKNNPTKLLKIQGRCPESDKTIPISDTVGASVAHQQSATSGQIRGPGPVLFFFCRKQSR